MSFVIVFYGPPKQYLCIREGCYYLGDKDNALTFATVMDAQCLLNQDLADLPPEVCGIVSF